MPGRAAPKSTVRILSDGEEIGTVTATTSGEFVALLDADVKKSAQAIDLTSQLEGGPVFSSADQIIVLGRADDAAATSPIRADLPPPVLKAEAEAISVIQPATLEIPDNVSLDVITYGASAEVILVGRGQPGRIARPPARPAGHPMGPSARPSAFRSRHPCRFEARRHLRRHDQEIRRPGTACSC